MFPFKKLSVFSRLKLQATLGLLKFLLPYLTQVGVLLFVLSIARWDLDAQEGILSLQCSLVGCGLWYCLMSSHIFCSHWEFCVIWRFSWNPLLMTSTSASDYKLTFHCGLPAPTSDLHLSTDPVAFPGTCALLAASSSLATVCQTLWHHHHAYRFPQLCHCIVPGSYWAHCRWDGWAYITHM